jgi:hypothetical protein
MLDMHTAPPFALPLQAEILESEVKAKLAKSFAQLRHAVHHYAEVKRDVEQGLLNRENKLAERHQGEAYVCVSAPVCVRMCVKSLQCGGIVLVIVYSYDDDMICNLCAVDAKLRSLEASLAESRSLDPRN